MISVNTYCLIRSDNTNLWKIGGKNFATGYEEQIDLRHPRLSHSAFWAANLGKPGDRDSDSFSDPRTFF